MQFIGCCGDFQSQTKNWIPKFQNMDAVVFVVNLCSYDQALPPSPNNVKLMKCLFFFNLIGTERSIYTKLMETLFLFDAVVNCRLYKNTTIFLLFTGFEQLKDILDRRPLSDHFPDYKGGNSADAAFDYILRLFSRLNKARLSVHTDIISLENSTDFDLDPVLAALSDAIFSNQDSSSHSPSRPCLPQRTGSVTVMDHAQLESSSVWVPALR